MTIAPQRPPGLALDRLADDYSAPPNNGPAPPPPQEPPPQVGYYYDDDDDDEGDTEPNEHNEHGDSLISHVPTSTATPVLPSSQYEVNLEQEIAELEKQLAENQRRYQRLAVEGLVEIPVQGQGEGGATTKIVKLSHPPEEDEERMAELKKQIERSSAALLGGSPTLGFGLGRGGGGGGSGLALAPPQGAAGAGVGDAGEGVEGGPLIQPPPTGLLSWLTERRGWAAWIDRRPGLTVLVAAFFILIGLGLAVMGFSTHDTQEVVTVPASATGQSQSGANGTATTTIAATAPTALPTATALPAPTPPPLATQTLPPTTTKPPVAAATATVTATTTTNQSQSQSQSQNQVDLSWQPHGGYLPPRSLQIPALAVNVDRVVKAQSSLDTGAATGGSASGSGSGSGKAWFTLSSPITGTLYHFGGYPGESGTNLVLVGSYDTLGRTLEVLQQNDQVQVVNRQGGIYTYLLLSYPRLQAKLQSEAARGQTSTTATTPPATTTTKLTPLPTPSQAAATAITPDERLTAAALAQRYSEDQLVQIAHKDDLDTLEVPGLTRASSTITLISLPPPGAPADERIVVRGILAFVKPASYTLPGTPVP